MNRQATEELIKAFVEASNQGNSAAILSMVNEDVVHDTIHGSREIGVERLRFHLASHAAHFKEQMADVVVLSSEDGTRAAVEFTARGSYIATFDGMPKASGQRYAVSAGLFFEVEDGKIYRMTNQRNMQAWIEKISEV